MKMAIIHHDDDDNGDPIRMIVRTCPLCLSLSLEWRDTVKKQDERGTQGEEEHQSSDDERAR